MDDRESKPDPSYIPERFREDYDPEPWTDHMGVEHPINPRDVLSPEEFRDYQQERRQRARRRRR